MTLVFSLPSSSSPVLSITSWLRLCLITIDESLVCNSGRVWSFTMYVQAGGDSVWYEAIVNRAGHCQSSVYLSSGFVNRLMCTGRTLGGSADEEMVSRLSHCWSMYTRSSNLDALRGRALESFGQQRPAVEPVSLRELTGQLQRIGLVRKERSV